VDILVGVNVIALEQDTFLGTKIRAMAEAGGFELANDGTYQYCDDHGNALYSLSNQESAPFNADSIKSMTTHGLTLLFDVPRIPNGLRAFDHMIAFARHLTESLRGLMVDDNLRPLTEDGVAKIKQQLSLIYGKMDKHGIPAGSARAQRLFS
jgi:FtsZ-interacting cell division protein ZipA